MAATNISVNESVGNPAEIRTFLADIIRTDIHLVALDGGEQSHGMWFADNAAAAADWALAYNTAGWNVYWTVNVVTPGTQSKPSKDQIARARFVHVDIDPPKGTPYAQWDRAAALARLQAMNPSFIIDSGGGWQGLWRLAEPSVDAALTEGVNRGAIAAVQGDPACWNIDRLLRVPGTINYPSALKMAAGRTPAPATLQQPDSGAAYSLGALFAPVAPPAPRVNVDIGPWTPLGPDDLVPPPSARLRAMIASEGDDRSKHCAAVASEMTACGYSPETIVGVLMNPANPVHAHVADQPYPERAAVRAMSQAASVSPTAAFGAAAPVLPAGASTEPPPRNPMVRDVDGEYMSPDRQLEYFRDCVYVIGENRIWNGKKLLDKQRFDSDYSGHLFVIDLRNEKKTDSAWDAFTKSRALKFPKVDAICFRPHHPSSDVIEEEGLRILNTFSPIETRRMRGDPSRFLDLLRRILPVQTDRDILLAYMASLVQNPGRKFQWWPVIQGTEGNGKTFILSCLEHVVGRRYTHMPNAPELARNGLKFNGWVMGNLLCGVEEISLGHKRDFLEEFKPIVTNRRVPIERKGVDQITGDNYLNGILMTNHQDGVPITVDTRRYAVFFTAQQCKEDKLRDGLNGRYFADLYSWAEGIGPHAALGRNGGYAIVADYLATYAIPAELDPAGDCTEAPRTSSFGAALHASLGRVEQEILECVSQGLPGFQGGWISSLYVDNLITQLRASVPRTKRRDMLRSLGYVPHPGLPDGRVNNAVRPDNARPRLYLKIGHAAMNLVEPAAIAKAYSDAQEMVTAPAGGNVLTFAPR